MPAHESSPDKDYHDTSAPRKDAADTAHAGGFGGAALRRDMAAEHESEVDEPDTTGTVFLTLILLMLIFGFWAMMYVILIDQ